MAVIQVINIIYIILEQITVNPSKETALWLFGYFCVAYIAWQTHSDHVRSRRRRRCRRHTFCFRSLTFAGKD